VPCLSSYSYLAGAFALDKNSSLADCKVCLTCLVLCILIIVYTVLPFALSRFA